MNKTIEFSINKKNNGERLDVFLSKKIKILTRSYIKKLIEKNNVRLNKTIITSASTKVKTNDKIFVNIIEEKNFKIIPKNIKLDIVYEDKDLLIINKPKGMVVHPGAGNYKDTLVNGLIYKYKNGLFGC
jgi:23S rRNA pseudouridine1911/1915/1917 synthase